MGWKFRHIELFVSDSARAKRFYVDVLGARITAEQGDGKFLWLDLGGIEILLRPGGSHSSPEAYAQGSVGLVLTTSDVAATKLELESRGLVFEGNDGPDCPTFRDPDGHWFQLVDQ